MTHNTKPAGEYLRGYEQAFFDLGAALGHHDLGLGIEMPPAESFPSDAALRGYIAGAQYRAYANSTITEGDGDGRISTRDRNAVEQAFNRLFEHSPQPQLDVSIQLDVAGEFASRVVRSDDDYDYDGEGREENDDE